MPTRIAPATTSKDARRMYGDLAWLWPIISPPENYVGEAELFAKLIRRHSKIPAKNLLHLGCGGGHIDLTLKKHFCVTSVDLSKEMLGLARILNPGLEYIAGDMRTVRLGRLFDAVVIADSITYMASEKDLKRAFVTAWEHLRPGGVLCTYAEHTVDRFKQNDTDVTTHRNGEIEVTILENVYDRDSLDTECELTFIYLIRKGHALTTQTDRHIAGLFRLRTWIEVLEEIGFEVSRSEYPGERIPMFACLKPL